MPIEGATVYEASKAFSDHLNRLLNRTLTHSRVVAFGSDESVRVLLSFREQGRPTSTLLKTKYGPMTLYVGQLCEGVEIAKGRQRLRTVLYKYTLTLGERNDQNPPEPLLRWEYVRTPEKGGLWCRHHLQGPTELSFGRAGDVSLNTFHLPTGYVPLEEIIRFCLVDLEVAPISANWSDIIHKSYVQFREEFGGPPD